MFLCQHGNAVEGIKKIEIAQTEKPAAGKSNYICILYECLVDFFECHIADCHFVLIQTEVLQYDRQNFAEANADEIVAKVVVHMRDNQNVSLFQCEPRLLCVRRGSPL